MLAQTLFDCLHCGAQCERKSAQQLFCTDKCRYRHRDSTSPDYIQRTRERCAKWAAEHRGVRKSNPWLKGAPPFGQYLPGGAFDLSILPHPKWPIELRNTRALHGLVTTLIGQPHDATVPGFSLVPLGRGCGWGVWVPDAETALTLAGRVREGVIFDKPVQVRCGPMHRIKSPRIDRRGHRKLRVDCLTPVHMRQNGRKFVTHRMPTSDNLCSTMAAWMPRRLGLALGPDDIQLCVVERATNIEHTWIGSKYGKVSGFVGSFVVDCNATAHWLLKAAETIGLGAKVAFGFGRIRVTDV